MLIQKATRIDKDYPSEKNILSAMEYFWKIFEVDLFFSKKYSEYFGIKPKMPYLDKKVISIFNQLPLKEKVTRKERKRIIKKLALKYLPRDLVFRKKIGLPQVFI